MPSELEALQGTLARYQREIDQARNAIQAKQREIAEAEAHARALKEIITHIGGKPILESISRELPRDTRDPLAIVPRQTIWRPKHETSVDEPVEQRGWIKEEILAYVNGVAGQDDRFSGRDIAQAIRSKGYKLPPYQYNLIYKILKEMDVQSDLVQRVPGSTQYEKRKPAAAVARERPITSDNNEHDAQ
jgi:hypothetical protein